MKEKLLKKKDIVLGKRIFLKNFLINDITKFYINSLNDKELTQYSRQRYIFHTVNSCISYLNAFKNNQDLFLKIVCKNSRKFIGTVTIHFSVNNKSADIGIFIMNKNFHNLGYATEVYKLISNWLFNNNFVEDRITAGTLRNNRPMIKVLKKAGFKFDYNKKMKIYKNKVINTLFFYKSKKLILIK